MTERQSRGETIPEAELVDYQRAKVRLLAEIARRDSSRQVEATLAAARAQLAELEGRRRASPRSGRTSRLTQTTV